MNVVGARWWKFDFHTHSPASFDYGKGDSSLKKTQNHKAWLLDFISKGIECVAVTDHNSGDWIDLLKEEAKNLRDEGKSIYVFPGVEITANSNIHILGIFDPSKTSADINSVVGASKFRGKRGNSDEVAEESAENIIREILNYGGVAIPAHIDMKTGLCQQTSVNTIRQVCNHASAVEIINPDKELSDAPLSRYKNLGYDLPSVIGSDAHHPDKIGRAYTWVKMSTPSIEGLRLALVDGSSSLIRSDEEKANPNQASNTLIHSIKIEHTKYAGRALPLELRFNPWLNSIIGGRGSGKSSVLEFIRIGMDRSKDLLELDPNNEIRRSFESFIKTSTVRESEGVMLDKSKITCEYIRDNVAYQLSWDKSTNLVSISRNEKGNWIAESGDAHSRFPIKIFSQKQIFDLAKNPNALLKLIDQSLTITNQQWKMDWQDKQSHFLTLCSQKRELLSRLSNKGILLGQLADVEQKILTLENSHNKETLNSFQSFSIKRNAIIKYETDIENFKAQAALNMTKSPNMDIGIFDDKNSSEVELITKLHGLSDSVNLFKESITLSVNKFEKTLAEFKTWYNDSNFNKSHAVVNADYNELIKNLVSQGVNSPADYSKLIYTREELKQSIHTLTAVEIQITEITQKINIAYQDIIEARKKLTSNRIDFLEKNLSNHSSIKIQISPLCDIDNLETSFRSVIGRPDGAFSSDIIDLDKETGFLFNLNRCLTSIDDHDPKNNLNLTPWFSTLHTFKEKLFNYNSGEIMGVKIGKRFIDFMAQQQLSKFDEINLWFPDDKLTIKFNDGKRFKDVSQGSAGQKASTILSFLLSYGTEPLILDQPEDDLDNGLITNLIVSKLRENKINRQIIVVTHNPNIVVNGDSEYVIALEDKGQISTTASGALQEVNVRKNVCEIMEGGEQALHKRYKRMLNL
ncbi:TrlF family AAA-like ATPase [Aeromonas veronii]|uniref:TrlF family AAA-like ATPase n=1 Tax=Aeromonas veronii TaxID=654 RepID=UPI0013969AFF|nr:PHP-associated domain-containing protein [Aeromonas veronii]